jgi:hypothetical protein
MLCDGFTHADIVPLSSSTAILFGPTSTLGHKAKLYKILNNNIAVEIVGNICEWI